MSEEELRKAIYERLGLEFASLPSESGNDWQRAKDEVLEEYRQKEFEKLKELKTTDYLSIEKNSEEFQLALNSTSLFTQNYKILIAQRDDLSEEEINYLIQQNSKDITINLTKCQKLNKVQIDNIIPNSVFLTKKYLIENQELTDIQKEMLKNEMSKNSNLYKELIIQI